MKHVTEWEEVSSRIMYVRMDVVESKYVIVGAYGPRSKRMSVRVLGMT